MKADLRSLDEAVQAIVDDYMGLGPILAVRVRYLIMDEFRKRVPYLNCTVCGSNHNE